VISVDKGVVPGHPGTTIKHGLSKSRQFGKIDILLVNMFNEFK